MERVKTYRFLRAGQEVTWKKGYPTVTTFPSPGTKTRIVSARPHSYNTHDKCPMDYNDDGDGWVDYCWELECIHGSTIIDHQLVEVEGYDGQLSSAWFEEAQL